MHLFESLALTERTELPNIFNALFQKYLFQPLTTSRRDTMSILS